ncbi:MAG: MSHA pilin protein MshC [Pseudohongiellaceae bacterium]|jgi:MSHA pilin protein MshC
MSEKKENQDRSDGFTIIELVVVIFVLAIISATAMSRFSNENAFAALVVRDQIISQARRAQQGAFGRANMSMVFTPNGAKTEATVEVLEASAALSSVTVSIRDLTLAGDTDKTGSCASIPGSEVAEGTPFTLTFGELGSLVASSGVAGAASFGLPTTAVRLCINQDINYSVCVSPSGFAYAGDCDV